MKKEVSKIAVLLLVISSMVFGAGGVLPGSGDHVYPYLIEDLADFDAFADVANAGTYWAEGVYTRLECDLDLSGRVYGTAVIAPYQDNILDSDSVVPYSGYFDGSGHTINNLTIDTNGNITKSVGLFGVVEGSVRTLFVEAVSIDAYDTSLYIGSICGELRGDMFICSSSGEVSGGGDINENDIFEECSIGGMCGYNEGDISTSCTSCEVNGIVNVGGFCGVNYGRITKSYSIGKVLVEGNPGSGFCGWSLDNRVLDCFWDIESSDCYYSNGGNGRLTLQMQDKKTFQDAGWYFVNEPNPGAYGPWEMEDYPKIRAWENLIHVPDVSGLSPAEAEGMLVANGLTVGEVSYRNSNTVNQGDVIETIPVVYSYANRGSAVGYVVSSGAYPAIPDLSGMEEQSAKAAIVDAGFAVGVVAGDYSDTVAAGEVISQVPQAGDELSAGGAISIIVSLGVPKDLDGSGTETNPYLIKNYGDFKIYADEANSDKYLAGGVYTRLECDLDLSFTEYADSVVPALKGVFDGNDHVVRNLVINSSGGVTRIGLFDGILSGYNGKICNLGVENVKITCDENSGGVGALCGTVYDGEIYNCYSTGVIKCGEDGRTVGGLLGFATDSKITDSYSTCEVSVDGWSERVGGLCGVLTDSSELYHCYASGKVEGCISVGGLCGDINSNCMIKYCYSTGDVFGSGYEFTGGFCGIIYGDSVVEDCYSTGNVFGVDYVGGFCGSGDASNCCAWGNVFGEEYVGGFVGEGNASKCFARGRVVGQYLVGGFCGFVTDNISDSYCTGQVNDGRRRNYIEGFCPVGSGLLSNCLWDAEASGFGSAGDTWGGSTGKTTAQMQTRQTFVDAGWELDYEYNYNDNVYIAPAWYMEEGSYPELQWIAAMDKLPGKGFSNDPFRIEDIEDFDNFCSMRYFWQEGVYTKLMCDLDLSGIEFSNSPIAPQYYTSGMSNGEGEFPYSGIFDGNEHIVKNVTIVSDGDNWLQTVGLFGKIYGENALVENLGVENINISNIEMFAAIWDYGYGGLCGENYSGTIRSCYTSGLVSGITNYYIGVPSSFVSVGGLCGLNRGGSIENSYSECDVIGTGGGLCAMNIGGKILNCYAVGDVAEGGGLCGEMTGWQDPYDPFSDYIYGSIENSFWDIEASGQTTSAGGEGKTTAEMQDVNTFLSVGWDFVDEVENGVEDVWVMLEGAYPVLAWEMSLPLSPDIDGDNNVDLVDFARLSGKWLESDCAGSKWCDGCDLNKSGTVEVSDLVILTEEWLR